MVRGPAALLILAVAGAALLLAAPVLPSLPAGDAETLIAGGAALVAIAAWALAVASAVEVPAVLWLALPAAGLLLGAVEAADLAAAATPAEALAYSLLGVALAAILDSPALALALPVFVGVIDVAGVLGGGSGVLQLGPRVEPGDPFGLELPAWGTTHAVGALNPAAVVFLAWYASYARRFGLDWRVAATASITALLAALVWAVVSGAAVPVLALLGAAFVLAAGGRLGTLARAARES